MSCRLATIWPPCSIRPWWGRAKRVQEASSPFFPERLPEPVGAEEAARLGLGQEPDIAREKPKRRPPPREEFVSSGATADILQDLLEKGDPNFRETKPWTPHRPARPEKSEGGVRFDLVSEYQPQGDQPHAIDELVAEWTAQERDQVLLGVTGSGKTFTMAQVISRTQRPALVLAPNKTLAAQLNGEFKSFFHNNAVEYLFATTIITSPKPMCRAPTRSSKRNP